MQYTLGVIGVGEFATHLIAGFMRSLPGMQVILSPRNAERARALRDEYGHAIAPSNAEVVARSEIVLLSTRPAQTVEAIAELPWIAEQLVISVAAGISLDELRALVGPADAVLCMPSNAAMIGSSIVPFYPDNPRARTLLRSLGTPVALPDEGAFGAAAVLGAHYGWLLRLMATNARWLTDHGVPEHSARALVQGQFASVAAIAGHRDDIGLNALADELNLPGGITAHGYRLFEENHAIGDWSDVMDSVLERLAERY